MHSEPFRERAALKLSAPDKAGYWEIPVLFEDEHLMALDKPAGLLTSPDRYDPERPNLMRLLHTHIARGVPWARERRLGYLANAHRLDFDTSGVLLLAKTKRALTSLANQFGSEHPAKIYFALVQGIPEEDVFVVESKLAPHPRRPGVIRVDPKMGKRSRTEFKVLTRYLGFSWIECQPRTGRTHQIRVHLQSVGCPLVGDRTYGGEPLLLSSLKSGFRRRAGEPERPLMARSALHAASLEVVHPVSGDPVRMTSPLPKDLVVALKYLQRFAFSGEWNPPAGPTSDSPDADDASGRS